MTVEQSTDASLTSLPRLAAWKAIEWLRVKQEVRRLQMRIAKATHLPPRDHNLVHRFERLEPYEGKLSRTVLRGAWAGNSPRLLGSRHEDAMNTA